MSTAKTTLLPANHSLGTKKGLHSNERLDDRLDPKTTFRKFLAPANARKLLEDFAHAQ
jgi:hypothetical protein